MNTDDLIALKVASLQNPSDEDLKRALQTALADIDEASRADIEAELSFTEQFWQETDPVVDVQPSPGLRADFYQSLGRHQQSKETTSGFRQFWHWLEEKNQRLLQPAFQFALVCVVFLAGMGTQSVFQVDDTIAVNELETQIEELNIMVALSLLDKPSAAERLSGVSYSSRSSRLSEPLINELLQLLESDRSSAVRLAIVETLSDSGMVQQIEQQLLAKLLVQDNTLVQLQLVSLLKQQGSRAIRDELIALADDPRLHDEVKQDLFEQHDQRSI